ncbi:MAG: hypothetical protein QHH26_07070 [Armatimonadota bacterium]|nr:hypothetical protein [Armatimonadota bacterium]
MTSEECIGEIIEATTTEFLAESRELHAPPAFGSFVKVPFDLQQTSPESLPTITSSQEEKDPFEEPWKRLEGTFSQSYKSLVEGEEELQIPPAIFGIVYHSATMNVDSNRRPRAYWKDEEKLKEEQPELAEWLLMTEFRAIIIGFSENGRIRRYLPPRPPKIHYFVYPCTTDEIRAITQSMDFLRTLSSFRNAPSDEVIAACIREAARAHQPNDFEFKVAAGKKLANLLKDDYERLEAIIRRVAP